MTGSVRWTLSSLVIHSIKQEFRDKKQIQSRDKTVQVMWNKPVFLLSRFNVTGSKHSFKKRLHAGDEEGWDEG